MFVVGPVSWRATALAFCVCFSFLVWWLEYTSLTWCWVLFCFIWGCAHGCASAVVRRVWSWDNGAPDRAVLLRRTPVPAVVLPRLCGAPVALRQPLREPRHGPLVLSPVPVRRAQLHPSATHGGPLPVGGRYHRHPHGAHFYDRRRVFRGRDHTQHAGVIAAR